MAEALNSSVASSEKLRLLVRVVARALGVRGCSIMLLDAENRRLFHIVSHGLSERYLTKGFLESEEVLAEALDGKTVEVLDITTDPRIQFPDMSQQERIVSILGVPLMTKGAIVGTLRVYSRTSREFTSREKSFVSTAANLAGLVLGLNHDIGGDRCPSEAGSKETSHHVHLNSQFKPEAFGHPSEEEFARLLDFYQIDWLYEPRSFLLDLGEGKGTEMFTPDFYLPGLDLYIEMTTMKPGLTRQKRRKVRYLREQYTEVNIKLLARHDYDSVLAKYGHGPLAGTKTRGVGQVYVSTAKIQRRVRQLGKEISKDYEGCRPVLVGVLRGVFCFMADLMRIVTVPADVDFMALTVYQDESEEAVRITEDLHVNIEGRHVLLVEDIVDTGMTLNFVLSHLTARNPASLKVCTLFDRRARRLADVPLKYVGFEAPDEFLVGYGLDYQEEYRNLPFVAVVEEKKSNAELRA
jgi:bifunctional protein TilS/HprT